MRNNILILLILTLLTLTSCNNINDNAEFDKGYNYDNYTEVGLSDDFNEFLGIWQVGMLKITPRVSLMDAEHAKTNSTVTGMVLDIKKDKVLFDDRVFYYQGYEECDAFQVMSLFNLASGQASLLCGGSIEGEQVELRDKYSTVIQLCDEETELEIKLLIGQDGEMFLWVGEDYNYVGFYELTKIS